MRVALADIHVTRVVPAPRRVFEKVYRADRKRGARHGDIRRDHRSGQEGRGWVRAARLNRSRGGQGVVDQMRSLQVIPAFDLLSDFESRIMAKALLNGSALMLDILGR